MTITIKLLDTLNPLIEKKRNDCPLDLFGSSVEIILAQFMSYKSIVEKSFDHIKTFMESEDMKKFIGIFDDQLFNSIEELKEKISEFVKWYFAKLFNQVFEAMDSSPTDCAAVKKAFEIVESAISELHVEGK